MTQAVTGPGPDGDHGVVVVGASVGGLRTVQALRRAKYAGPVHLVGAEQELPYDKPPLSKDALAVPLTTDPLDLVADPVRAAARLVTEEQMAALDVRLHLGTPAERLDVAGRTVDLADGRRLPYDHLVIATGARARPAPWRPDSGLHVLRTLDDCRAVRADLALGGPVVVVGGGFIGSEVAATCRALGLAVTVVDPEPVPLARAAGVAVGARMAALHERHGTGTRFSVGVAAVDGARGHLRVHLTDGTVLDAATVVVGIGAVPNDEWLADSGLVVDDGVVCDAHGRTGSPDVYAVGDVARWDTGDDGRGRRVEHWTSAVDQATAVARTITNPGSPATVTAADFVWSDQYDWKLHLVGTPSLHGPTTTVEPGPNRFATLVGDDDGHLRGAAVVNWPQASVQVRKRLPARPRFDDVLDVLRALA